MADAENLWPIEADEGQITQVIQNIVLNASQAMPEGGRVEVSTRNIQAADPELPEGLREGRYVEVAIRDQGTGISRKDFSRIFDPYFTTKEKGSGLGLATSYSIVKQHGGSIRVDSRPGETTFFIYLPASVPGQVQAQAKPKQNVLSRQGRILVMDDEPMIRQVAGALLDILGHEAEFAVNGQEALAKYKAAMRAGKPFDAVILDLTIRGGTGGEEAVKMLAAIDPGVKAVVSSGYADSAIVANYRDYGFFSFLSKPYNLDGLSDVLREIFDDGAGD